MICSFRFIPKQQERNSGCSESGPSEKDDTLKDLIARNEKILCPSILKLRNGSFKELTEKLGRMSRLKILRGMGKSEK